jgi:hypothetical protein
MLVLANIFSWKVFALTESYSTGQNQLDSTLYDESKTVSSVRKTKIVWDYPVKPGTPEWLKFTSMDEMYKGTQISENILKKLDTESLVQIVLNYPALPVLLLFNSPQDGFDNLYSNFNGIRELIDRKDAGQFLLKKYKSLSFSDFNPLWTLEKQGEFVHKYYYIEILLAQPQVIESLTTDERRVFLKEVIKKFDEKQSKKNLFGGNALEVNAWVLARTLNTENKSSITFSNPVELKSSLKSGQLSDSDLYSVYGQAKKYISHE